MSNRVVVPVLPEHFAVPNTALSPVSVNEGQDDAAVAQVRRRKSMVAMLDQSFDLPNNSGITGDNADAPLVRFALRGMNESHASQHTNPCRAHERAIRQLRNLTSKSDENRRLILAEKTVPLILQSLRQYSTSDELHEQGCRLLSELVRGDDDGKREIISHGGLSFLVGSLNDETTPKVAVAVLSTLGILVEGSPEMQAMVAEFGGIGDALTMLGHNEVVVQTEALFLIEHLVSENAKNKDRLTDLDGTTRILHVLETLPHNEELAAQGTRAISALVEGNLRICDQLGCMGAVEIVVQVMEANSKAPVVLHEGCRALRFLAFSDENRFRMGEKFAILSAVKAIVEMQRSPDYVMTGLLCLSNATFDLSPNIYVAGISGGVDATVCIMKLYPQHPDLLEAGCRVLRNLSDWIATACEQLILDTLETVVQSMDSHFGKLGIQEHGLCMFVNLLQRGVHLVVDTRVELLADRCIEAYDEDDTVRSAALELHHLLQQARYEESQSKAGIGKLFSGTRLSMRGLIPGFGSPGDNGQ